MYTVRTRFYTHFYIVSKRKQNDQEIIKLLSFVGFWWRFEANTFKMVLAHSKHPSQTMAA